MDDSKSVSDTDQKLSFHRPVSIPSENLHLSVFVVCPDAAAASRRTLHAGTPRRYIASTANDSQADPANETKSFEQCRFQ